MASKTLSILDLVLYKKSGDFIGIEFNDLPHKLLLSSIKNNTLYVFSNFKEESSWAPAAPAPYITTLLDFLFSYWIVLINHPNDILKRKDKLEEINRKNIMEFKGRKLEKFNIKFKKQIINPSNKFLDAIL